MAAESRVCETCLDSAGEECLASEDELELFCIELGSDIADHLCEEIETFGETHCDCACHPSEKQRLRTATLAKGSA